MINKGKLGIKVIVLLLSIWFPGKAVSFSGNDLYDGLQQESPSDLFYVGYISGVAKMGKVFGIMGQCITLPETATPQQTADVVRAYLRDNPAERHRDAMLNVLSALQDAFGISAVGAEGWCGKN